jgi:outer membrane protein TolC
MKCTMHFRPADLTAYLLSVLLCVFGLAPSAFSQSELNPELEALTSRALAGNPLVSAARARVRAAMAEAAELDRFFDPALVSSAERYEGLPGRDLSVAASVEAPLRSGFSLGAGVEEHYLDNPNATYSQLYRTIVRTWIRVPLLQDRGFRQWSLQQRQRQARVRAAVSDLLWILQDLRHRTELAYIQVQQSFSSREVARAATERVESLLSNTEEYVSLKTVPEYQLYAASMEVAIARSSQVLAEQSCQTALVDLATLIGDPSFRDVSDSPERLVQEAHAAKLPSEENLDEVLARRGDYVRIEALLEEQRMLRHEAADTLRPDLTLEFEAYWEGEDPTAPLHGGTHINAHPFGSRAAIVYRRPLGYRGERARVAVYQARINALERDLEQVRLTVQSQLSTARENFAAAKRRLDLATEAVGQATRNLEAEEGRFQLGEGRSRDVLDAQNFLTTVVQQQTTTAAALLRARSDLEYARGYVIAEDLLPSGGSGSDRHGDSGPAAP